MQVGRWRSTAQRTDWATGSAISDMTTRPMPTAGGTAQDPDDHEGEIDALRISEHQVSIFAILVIFVIFVPASCPFQRAGGNLRLRRGGVSIAPA